MKQGLAVIILFVSSVGWGLTWLPLKGFNQMGLDGIHLVFIAFAGTGLLLSPLLFAQRRFWRGNYRYLLLIALFGGLANMSFQTAIVQGNVVRVMILFYLLPVWSVLGGWYLLNERPDRLRFLAVVISLAGAMVILDVDSNTFRAMDWVDALAISAGFFFALNNIVFRKTAEQPLAGKVSAMFLGCAALTGICLMLSPVKTAMPDNISPFYAFLYGVCFLNLITFGTQWGVTQLEAGRAALIIVMELVTAVVSVALLTDLNLTPKEFIGALMVTIAAVLEGWREPLPATAETSQNARAPR